MNTEELTTGNVIQEITLKYRPRKVSEARIRCSTDAYNAVLPFYNKDTISLYESVLVFFVNSSFEMIGFIRHSQGGMTETTVDPRLIIGTALKCGATGIILTHNHPSGNIEPSHSDDKFTQKIMRGCKYMDIMLLDHLIVSEKRYFSYMEHDKLTIGEDVRI